MLKVAGSLIFAAAMLVFAVVALVYSDAVRELLSRLSGPIKPPLTFTQRETVWSIKIAGAIAALIGVIILWAYWRSR